VADPFHTLRHIPSPLDVASIRAGERPADVQGLAIGNEPVMQLAPCDEHVANCLERAGESLLGLPIAGSLGRKPAKDLEALAIGCERSLKITVGFERVADRIKRHRHLTPPFSVRRVLGRGGPGRVKRPAGVRGRHPCCSRCSASRSRGVRHSVVVATAP